MKKRQEFKKIMVLENDQERFASLDHEKDLIEKSFPNLPVEFWYRFFFSFTNVDGNTGPDKMMGLEDDTLLLTFTTFTGGPVSGWGDILGMWLRIFNKFGTQGKKLNIAVGSSPALSWEIIKWVTKEHGKTKEKARAAFVRQTLKMHNVYALSWGDDDFYNEAIHLTPQWFNRYYYPYNSEVINEKGITCRLGTIYAGSRDEVTYSLSVPINGNQDHTTGSDIEIEALIKLNPKKK